jgi:hypothetical protein
MPIKNEPDKPTEVPLPQRHPEIIQPIDPGEPIIPLEDPDIIRDEDPFENPPLFEMPEPGEGP